MIDNRKHDRTEKKRPQRSQRLLTKVSSSSNFVSDVSPEMSLEKQTES